jgi:hypothetical protein
VIRPSAAAGLLLRLTHLEIPAGGTPPKVGTAVRSGETLIGQVDHFTAARQEIARYTSDEGDHVHLEFLRSDDALTP